MHKTPAVKKYPFWVLLGLLLNAFPGTESSEGESKLMSNLLENYNKLVRPVTNASQPLMLTFGITVLQIMEVCEADSVFKTNIWLALEWDDPSLIWDPKNYDDILDVRIPPSRVWIPDIYAYNSVAHTLDTTFQTDVVIRSNGSVTYIPPGIFETTCKFTNSHFPFDHQECNIKFGSWTYGGGKLDIRLKNGTDTGTADLGSFVPHPAWELVGVTSRRNTVYYDCCPYPYVDIAVTFALNRKAESIMMEARTFNFFIFVTLFLSFLIPAASAHKISLAILHVINSYYPLWCYVSRFPHIFVDTKNGSGPLIFYFQLTGILGVIGLIANILTVWIWHQKGRMPESMGKLVEKIGKILFMGFPGKKEGELMEVNGVAESKELGVASSTGASKGDICRDWQCLANIVDRCFFFLFVVVGAIIWIALFPTDPSK